MPSSPGVRSDTIQVAGSPIHLLEAGSGSPVLLMLHGAAFRAETWRELGTLEQAAAEGLRVVALDLPGYGDSPSSALATEDFLGALVAELGLQHPVIVSPSMSGAFSLPFVLRHPERVAGYVPVAPAALDRYADELASMAVPVLVVWGSADRVFPLERGESLAQTLPDAELLVLEGARHPCYLDQPDRFHRELFAFARRCGR